MKSASRRRASADRPSRPKGPDDEFLRIARARFRLIQDAEKDQRERELEDLRFYAGDQWPADVITARNKKLGDGNLPDVAARPTVTINKAREPVREVLNQERQSDLGVSIVPADDFAGLSEPVNADEIELREGLVRRIQRTSDAAAARTWAFERATIAGRGYYGVMVKFGDGKTWDREIYDERFYDQSAVSLGPHDQPDGSDAEYGFVGSWLTWDDYVAEYPFAKDEKRNKRIAEVGSDADFMALGEEYPGWFKTEGTKDKTRMCRVVRYWYTDYTSRALCLLPDGSSAWKEDVPEGITPIDTRRVVEKTIKCAKIDGSQILEDVEWEGHYLPIVKVLGEELQPYGSERRSEGMVRPGIEAGRAFNVLVSKLVETIGHTPLQPLILDPESIEGWEDWYKYAAVRAFPYLPQRSRNDEGREFAPAHRPDVDPNLQPMAMAIGMFDQFIQSTMGVHSPSLGKSDPALRSSKMLETVVAQDAHGTSNFIDNLARSVSYEGKIINDLLYPIYGKPGRIAKILNGAGEPETVMLHQPYTMQGGKPQPVMMPHPTDPTQSVPMPAGHPMTPPNAKTYTLSKDAQFNVAVKVTKNFDLRRDQLATFLGQLIGANPQEMAIYGDLFWKSLDVPDHELLSDRAKLMLAPAIQQALAAKAQGMDIPPPVRAQMGQLTQRLKELEGVAAKQQHAIDTEQVKRDSDERIERMKLDYQADEKAKDRAAKIEEARILAAKQSADLAAEAREEAMALASSQVHEASMAAADANHEATLSAQEHGQTLQQGAQAAALAPPAANGNGQPNAGA